MVVGQEGSSPLSRGILTNEIGGVATRGIIPALAGNTTAVRASRIALSDHPRSRGEYLRRASPAPAGRGSSPLSRGIRLLTEECSWTMRIIPALAGNTRSQDQSHGSRKDHPRSRGEYAQSSPVWPPVIGSSPLSRGIRASAGGLGATHGDHPRSRGEYTP